MSPLAAQPKNAESLASPDTLPPLAYSIDINPADPNSIDAALNTEWLLTNGLGGFAMGTVLGTNTRRYHALFIPAIRPPVGRIVALHSMIEQLIIGERVIDLSTQQFGQQFGGNLTRHPDGWRWLKRVVVEPPHRVTWTYVVEGTEFMRRLSLDTAQQAARVEYEIVSAPRDCIVRFRPFISLRDFHALDHERDGGPSARVDGEWLNIERQDSRARLPARAFRADPQWWRNFAYRQDRQRGQDWHEDVWSPGIYEAAVETTMRTSAGLVIELPDAPRPDAAMVQELEAVAAQAIAATSATGRDDARDALRVAAAAFVVARHSGSEQSGGRSGGQSADQDRAWNASVIAGYPWFGDWGRDTMISLPGLFLTRHRFEGARRTLTCFARNLKNGLLPNLFDDYGGAAHYNTVDASLWFVHAVREYARAAGGKAEPDLVAACRTIVAAYRNGTDYKILMDSDGLISAGDATTQLTWMDAARDGVIFTPRCGKAVEINALWHNALIALSELSDDAKERNDLLMLARQSAASFRSAFWWEQRQCLHDCLAPSGSDAATGGNRRYAPDGKLRPNQIFAASLPHSPLNDVQKRAVVKAVGERLLTPFGLRTLDRDDPNYKPRYEGNLFERDAAYHNGTVWPWLLGPYCEALLRVENFSAESKSRVKSLLQPLIDEMSNATANGGAGRCLGHIAEVYDAEPPHRPSGCPAQAWSVAETLRVLTLASA